MAEKSVVPLGKASTSTTDRPRFFASSSAPWAAALGKSVSSWMRATVFSPLFAAMSMKPSRYTSLGEFTMKTNLRPFL